MASRMRAACTATIILALAGATTLRAAAVVTGDVSPPLPWSSSTSVTLGDVGDGTLAVDAGSQLASANVVIGQSAGAVGEATITGPRSKWTNSSSLSVGENGRGTLRVEASAQVSSTTGFVARNVGSSGEATVMGVGSRWINSSSLHIGRNGGGTLRVEAGGRVDNTTGYLGYDADGSGAATITGAGSQWINSSHLYVAYEGEGSLTVADGGLVTTGTLHARLADLHGNGTITATKGAVLDGDLRFDAAHGTQASLSFGDGGTLTVTAAAGGFLGAGYNGQGSLTVADGIAVTSDLGFLGDAPGATGSATVTGAGSKWTTFNSLYIGDAGNGSLRIEAGGQVVNGPAYMGYDPGTTGAATVTGVGSKWTNNDLLLYVGRAGNGSLRIEAGGEVSTNRVYMGFNAGATGAATVTGVGSKWTSSQGLHIGISGSASLRIEAGGEVSTLSGNVGAAHIGDAIVTGSGSKWTNSNSLYVGEWGRGTLRVEAGAQVSGAVADVGGNSAGTGEVIVTGSGSLLTTSAALRVGMLGNGTLRVEAGGQASSNGASIGYASSGSGHVTITGPGSLWSNSSYLDVGDSGIGTLNITNGGLATVFTTLTIARSAHFTDSFVNMATGGMLALRGNAAGSLAQFLGLVSGTGKIRYWDSSLGAWALLTAGANGVDYTLAYQASGGLAGYTLLTVGALPALPGDFNGDGIVDGTDFLRWQRGESPLPNSIDDLALWQSQFGAGGTAEFTVVPEPSSVASTLLASSIGLLSIHRRRPRTTRTEDAERLKLLGNVAGGVRGN